jgi:uncharacterized membrane protein YgcG
MRSDDESMRLEARTALADAAEPLDDTARARVRARVMAEARSNRQRTPLAVLTRHRLAAATTAFALLSSGTAYAANESLPGDPLYAVKRVGENVLVAIVPPGQVEQRLLVGLAARRAEEVAALARRGETAGTIDASLEELRDAMRRATPLGGSLTEQDRERIREHADEAPDPTRSRINEAVDAPSPPADTGDQNTAPSTGTGTDGTSGSDTTNDGGQDSGSGSGTGGDAGTGGTGSGPGQGQPDSGNGSGAGNGSGK